MKGRLEVRNKVKMRIEKKLTGQPEYLRDWIESMYAARKSPKTVYNYLNNVLAFMDFAEESYGITKTEAGLNRITPRIINKYFIKIQTKEEDGDIVSTSISFCKGNWFALNSFFQYMTVIKLADENVMQDISKPQGADQDVSKKDLLTLEDFNRMLKCVAGDNSYEKIRNRAMLQILMTTGIRCSALCELNIEDVDTEQQILKVVDKRDQYYDIPLNDDAYFDILRWIGIRSRFARGKKSPALFLSRLGNRIDRNVVYDLVSEVTEKAIGKALSPHKIRGGFCSILYEQTHDIEFVRKAVGHKDVNTTQRYITTDNSERRMAGDIIGSFLR